ncbi:MAG TPA: hypothetical protein VNZ49_09200 [Bacteroidia bacterium]|jgi:hypothetical protein|nr:hypothetical protein [Bacteroidia bacterium]
MEESGLFELIKTLGKSEKRYFKKYAAMHGARNNTHAAQLFDALEEVPEYNDTGFKKSNHKKPFYKNLASEKQHLMKVLLQSLNEFHRNNDTKSTIRFHLDSFELLFQKRQYKLCEKHLLKASRLCKENGYADFFPGMYRSFGKLYQHSGNLEKLKVILDEMEKDENKISSSLKNEIKLTHTEYNFYYTSRLLGYPRTKKDRSAYEDIYKPAIDLNEDAVSFKEKLNLLLIKNYYYDTYPDKKPLMKVREEWVKLAETKQKYIEDNSMQYLVCLNNLANSYDELGMKKELELTLEKIINYPKKNLDEEVRTFIYYYNLKMVGRILEGNFDECVALFPQVEAGKKKLWRWFHPEYKLSFRYLFSYGYFGARQYQQSLKWINEILINYPKETLEEYYNFARIFILLIYFELGYEGLLASELRSANRYFNKKDKLFSLEKIILAFMKSSLKPEGILSTKKEFRELKEKITELKNSPYEQQLFSLFDWEAWAESKISGVPFDKIMREKSEGVH